MKKLITLICAMHSLSAVSQQQTDTLKNIELPAASIKASKISLSSEKVLRVLTKQTIERLHQTQDIPYLLNTMSNVVVSSDAGTGTGYTDIKVRGTDITRMNVTMNGVPVNDPESQATYFVNTPDLLSSAQQVELVKGVGNSTNGNGSFGASLALNTLDIHQTKPGAIISFDAGSMHTFKWMAKATTGLVNQRWVSTIRLSSLTSDGYIKRSVSNLKALQFTTQYRIHKNATLTFNYLKGREKTGQAWNGVLQDSLATNRTFNELGIKSDGTYYSNQTDNYGQDYHQLFYDWAISDRVHVGTTLFYTKGKGYYEEYKVAQSYTDYNLTNPIIGNDTLFQTDLIRQLWLDNHFYGGRAYINLYLKKLTAGLYVNLNQYRGFHHGDIIWSQYAVPDGYQWYRLTSQKNDQNVYGMISYAWNSKWQLLADVQYRHVNYIINGFRKNPSIHHALQWNFFNPKIKVSYQSQMHTCSVMAGIAQKEPNRDDIEAGQLSLPKPEKLLNTEINYIFHPSSNWALYATAYGMYYRDQLVLTGKINDVGAYTRTNVPESYRIGIELETKYQIPAKWLSTAIHMAMSRNKIVAYTEYLDDYDNGGQIAVNYNNTDISFSPNVIAGFTCTINPLYTSHIKSFSKASVDVMAKYVGKQYMGNNSLSVHQLNSFATVDIMVNMPINIRQQEIKFRLGLLNCLNTLYEPRGYTYSFVYDNQINTVNYYYPQSGIRAIAGLQMSF